MKKYYYVNFEYSENVFCVNIAHAESAEAVENHYSKYNWCYVQDADSQVVETARRKHMPIIEIE